MKQNILVLFAKPYEIKNASGVVENTGITVYYYPADTLKPSKLQDGSMGQRVAKANYDAFYKSDFVKVPALYEGDLSMNVGSDGKANLHLDKVTYISDVELTSVTLK